MIKQLEEINLDDFIIRHKIVTEDELSNESKLNLSKIIDRSCYHNINTSTKSARILPKLSSVAYVYSHLKCWRYIVDWKLDNVLIINEDLEIVNNQNFIFDISSSIHFINNSINKNQPRIIMINPYDKILKQEIYELKGDDIVNTNCYIINSKGADFLIKNMMPFKFCLGIQLSKIIKSKPSFSGCYIEVYGIDSNSTRVNAIQKHFYYFIENKEIQILFPKLPRNIIDNIDKYIPLKKDIWIR